MDDLHREDPDSKLNEEISIMSVEGNASSDVTEGGWDFGRGAIALSGCANSKNYCMNYPRKGKCFIFNHREFDTSTKLNKRKGTGKDTTSLCDLFEELGFNKEDIQCFVDLKAADVKNVLESVAKEDNTAYACFICCILTQGYSGMLYAKDKLYEAETILAPFRADVCPTFAGKPKIFIIQACEGDKCDRKGGAKPPDLTDSGCTRRHRIKLPTHADFLIACCRIPGYYAWETEENGSWFIQALCDILRKNAKEKNLLQILIKVNREVAEDFENYLSVTVKKQVPYITTTLTKNVLFYSNNHSEHSHFQDPSIDSSSRCTAVVTDTH